MKNIEFKKYNLTINLTHFINIVGSSSSGKSRILKSLINKINDNDILIDGITVSSLDTDFLRHNIAAVLKDHVLKKNYYIIKIF